MTVGYIFMCWNNVYKNDKKKSYNTIELVPKDTLCQLAKVYAD